MKNESPLSDRCGHQIDDLCLECEGPKIKSSFEAVRYLLDRIQRQPDLRWHMLHTQAMALLCAAEAMETAKPYHQVKEYRERDLQPPHDRRQPEIVIARRRIEQLEKAISDPYGEIEFGGEEKLRQVLTKVRELLYASESEIFAEDEV